MDAGVPAVVVRFRKSGINPEAHAPNRSKWHGASAEVLEAMQRLKPDLSFKVLVSLMLSCSLRPRLTSFPLADERAALKT